MKKILITLLILFVSTTAHAGIFEFYTFESPFTDIVEPPPELGIVYASEVRNQGWWTQSFGGGDENDNYITGLSGQDEARNFFTFDISSLSGMPVSAELELTLFQVEGTGNKTYSLFDVSTDAATLNFNEGVNASVWEDLGTGANYGSTVVTQDPGLYRDTILSIPLNNLAVADIKQTNTQFFSIGGKLINPLSEQRIFGSSDSTIESIDGVPQRGIQRLTVYTEDSRNVIPEPATMLLFGSGMMGMFFRRRKNL